MNDMVSSQGNAQIGTAIVFIFYLRKPNYPQKSQQKRNTSLSDLQIKGELGGLVDMKVERLAQLVWLSS